MGNQRIKREQTCLSDCETSFVSGLRVQQQRHGMVKTSKRTTYGFKMSISTGHREKIDGKSVVVIAGTLQSLRKVLSFSI